MSAREEGTAAKAPAGGRERGRVAVFAGTTEGRELCRALADAGRPATAFVATDYGADLLAQMDLPGIEVHAGRLGRSEMEATLAAGGFAQVVDATHPYAREASENIRSAADTCGLRYLRLLRPATDLRDVGEPGLAGCEPPLVEVPDAAAAVRFLAGVEGAALLTTGSKDLPTFATLPDFATRLYARILSDAAAVARARELGFPAAHLICMQGPIPREMNVATLRMVGARWMVTKDAGRAGGMPEKLAAARETGVGLVVVARPPEAGTTYDFAEVCGLLGIG